MQDIKLWENEDVILSYYPSLNKSTDATVILFPGGGYGSCTFNEGEGYAQLFNTFGMDAFVLYYRLSPNRFPLPLLDARRAVRSVRSNSERFGISKNKVLVMGSSAGGHLAALISTYDKPISGEGVDEIDREDFLPNGQILCYPVISSDEAISNIGSYKNLLGDDYDMRDELSPDLLVKKMTPKAFIWHTAEDKGVNVINSYRYAEALRMNNIPHELHVFPHGRHGLGLSPHFPYDAEWTRLLRRWLSLNGFICKI